MELLRYHKLAALIAFCFLFGSISPMISAQESSSLSSTIHTNWMGEESHGYIIKFNRSPSAEELGQITVNSTHFISSSDSEVQLNHSWGNGLGITEVNEYSILMPDAISYGDNVEIKVFLGDLIISSRVFKPVIWSQPILDHEITLSTNWELDQSTLSPQGQDNYVLIFDGQGWQKRTGSILEANELGNGTLTLNESNEDGNILFDLILDSVWRNETTKDGILTDSEFEMKGNGSVSLFDNTEGELYVNITVLDALINRSSTAGNISEEFSITGFGGMNLHQEKDDEITDLNGEISFFRLEYVDLNGERVKDYNDIVATAVMEQHYDSNHIYLEVNELRFFESWKNGERVEEHNLISAHGTFDIYDREGDKDKNDTGEEDSEGTTVNGTIVHFETESIDGHTVEDYMHVYGTISGDTQGTWGLLREIEDVGPSANNTGDIFTVNVIHSQVWYNITGAAGFFADEIGVGAYHNQTWDYQVKPIDWENRTIRYAWKTTGADPSEGEEYPENSPIQSNPDSPIAESQLGNISVGRETGLCPESMFPGDKIRLDQGDLFNLDVEATDTGTILRDGHEIPVTNWKSINDFNSEGVASGSVVNSGILAGLLAEVSREITIKTDLGEALFSEYQTLQRILSPSIVTEEENNEPEIIDVRFREGYLLNDGGNTVHLEVLIADEDWNVRDVSVEITLGDYKLETMELNDRGLDGDLTIQDDIWTTSLVWNSELHGELDILVEVNDLFSDVSEIWTLNVSNSAPVLIESTLEISQSARSSVVGISVKAQDANGVNSVSVDLRLNGGELFVLTYQSDQDTWEGDFIVPNTIIPGTFRIPILLEDSDGAYNIVNGPSLLITNEGPKLKDPVIKPEKIISPLLGEMSEEEYLITVQVDDNDGISAVQIKFYELLAGNDGNSWKLMSDDGSNGDLVAGDGIYSISFNARHLPPGFVEVELRGVDIYGQSTVIKYDINIESKDANLGTDPSQGVIDLLSNPFVIISLLVFLVAIVVLVLLVLRKNDLNFGNFGDD